MVENAIALPVTMIAKIFLPRLGRIYSQFDPILRNINNPVKTTAPTKRMIIFFLLLICLSPQNQVKENTASYDTDGNPDGNFIWINNQAAKNITNENKDSAEQCSV